LPQRQTAQFDCSVSAFGVKAELLAVRFVVCL
jgi:hypothetical protein